MYRGWLAGVPFLLVGLAFAAIVVAGLSKAAAETIAEPALLSNGDGIARAVAAARGLHLGVQQLRHGRQLLLRACPTARG